MTAPPAISPAPAPPASPGPATGRRGFDPLAWVEPRPNAALIGVMGVVNRALALPRLARVARLDLPSADLGRLLRAVNPETAAFLAPNHPEFFTDWMIDKELSRRASPMMAHWATWEIVNGTPLTQRFWLANNLVSNVPGGHGRTWSVHWALAGHGVLLHPEGGASWRGARVEPLLPGVIDMAWETCAAAAARGDPRPVFVVPIVWALRFARDATAGLCREIDYVARSLALPPVPEGPLGVRMFALQRALLARVADAHGLPAARVPANLPGADYFAAQQRVADALRAELVRRHGPLARELARLQFATRRSIRALAKTDAATARADRVRLEELVRLESFDPGLYGTPRLSQEQIAETIKRARLALVHRSFADRLHGTLPRAVAPRIGHVRVAEPLDVRAAWSSAGDDGEATRARLLASLHERMQSTLTALGAALAPATDARAVDNPMAPPGSAAVTLRTGC